ncbi:MAG: C4-dicarboxylate TRAP transporter substrate-binding protein [Sneathiellaceae bacterium]
MGSSNPSRSGIGLAALAGAGLLGLALAAAPFGSGRAEAKELIYGSWLPQAEYTNSVALPKIFEEIKAETNGEIDWRLVPGGQLANPKTTFDAVQNGLMAAGIGISSYVPNLIPATNTIYGTVQFGTNPVVAGAAATETLTLDCPECLAEFRKINAVPLAGWTVSPYYFACREPVASLADLKGKRVRATGVGNTELVAMTGAVPVAATLVEAVSLLQRGGLDCTFGVVEWLRTFGYADFVKYLNTYPLGMTGPAVGLMMNRDVWDELTPEQKNLHLKKAAWFSAAQSIGQFTDNEKTALAWAQKDKGLQLVNPPDPAEFKKLTEDFDKIQRQRNIDTAKGFGVKDPGAIIDAYNKNYAKWEKLSKEIGGDIDKMAELVWQEIYSKVDPATY